MDAAAINGRYARHVVRREMMLLLSSQHAGPNEATYITGSPISRDTIHGQRGFLRSSLMPGFYPEQGDRGKTNSRTDFRSTGRRRYRRGESRGPALWACDCGSLLDLQFRQR